MYEGVTPLNLSLGLIVVALILGVAIYFIRTLNSKRQGDSRRLLFARTFNRLLDGEREGLVDDLLRTYKELDHDVSIGLALGALYRHMGKLQMALRLHRSILAEGGLEPELKQRIQNEIAKDYLSSGLLERAQNELEKALSYGPLFDDLRQTGIRVFLALRLWDKATQLAGKGLPRKQSKQASSLVRTEQAEWLLANQKYQEAQTAAKKAISLDSQNYSAAITLSRVYFNLEKLEKARNTLENAIPLVGNQAWRGFSTFKDVAIKMNDHQWLIQSMNNHLEKNPDDWRTKAVLSSFLFKLGDSELAGRLLLECLQAAPEALYLHQKMWKLLLRKPLQTDVIEQYSELMRTLLPIRNPFTCASCGITSSQYHWQCPSCHQFGSYKERTL